MSVERLLGMMLIGVIALNQPAQAGEEPAPGARAWHVLASTGANLLPVASAFASPRCLPGYILCKLSFAGMGVVASGVQVIAGGDIEGARATLSRAFGGDWVVTPSHIATSSRPDPYPEVAQSSDDDALPDF